MMRYLSMMSVLIGLMCAFAHADEVILKQTSPASVTIGRWPTVAGIPLPRGVLNDAGNAVIVNDEGAPVPAQIEAIAHWSPKRQWIKWLRLVIDAPQRKGESPRYRLVLNGDTKPPTQTVNVQQTDDAVTIDTGPIQLHIDPRRGGWIQQVTRDGKAVYRADVNDGSYILDQHGHRFEAVRDKKATVTIEEQGPMRSVVRVEAWHRRVGTVSEDAPIDEKQLNKCVLRYYACAGQPWIELHWTFVITADTDAVQFSDIGLRFASRQPTKIGLEDGATEIDAGHLIQKKSDLYVVRDGTRELTRGSRAPGWASTGSLGLAVRDFWQTFPNEIEKHNSALILHAWPAHGEYNDDWFVEPDTSPPPNATPEQIIGANGVALGLPYFQRLHQYHHGRLMDLRYPQWWHGEAIAGTKGKKNWLAPWTMDQNWAFWCLWSRDAMPQDVKEHAAGTSRTHELLLDFSGDEAAFAARRNLFSNPPHVWLEDPAYLEKVQLWGPINVAAAKPWIELSKRSWELVDRNKHYGMWLHGEVPEYFADDHTPSLYRTNNGGPHYRWYYTEWMIYLCTGRPEHLMRATINTRQHRDIAMVHYSDERFHQLSNVGRKTVGALCTVGFYRWRMGVCLAFYSGCWPHLMDYYLTGDRRSLDSAELHMKTVISQNHAAGVGDYNFKRGGSGEMKALLDWYAHSWDEQAKQQIDDAMQRITENDPTAQRGKYSSGLMWTNFVPQYLEMTKNPDVPLSHRDAVRDWALTWTADELISTHCNTGTSAPGAMQALCWFETGDEKYLRPFIRDVLRKDRTREQALMPAPYMIGTGGDRLADEELYAFAAWRDAYDRNMVPPSEKQLSRSREVAFYRTPGPFRKKLHVYFLKEKGKPLHIACHGAKPELTFELLAPDGSVAATATTTARCLPFELHVPAEAPDGVYRSHLKHQWMIKTESKHVYDVTDSREFVLSTDWALFVPEGTKQIQLDIIIPGYTSSLPVFYDADFKAVATPKQGVKALTLDVSAETAGRFWHIDNAHYCYIGPVTGIPPYVAAHESYWFNPDDHESTTSR